MFSLSASPLYLLSSLTLPSPSLLTSHLGLSTPNNLGICRVSHQPYPVSLSSIRSLFVRSCCLLALSPSDRLNHWLISSAGWNAVRPELWVKNVREKLINLLSLLSIIPVHNNINASTFLAHFHSKQNIEQDEITIYKQMLDGSTSWLFG